MTCTTVEEALELLDDWACDHPLEALREYADLLTAYRLDACAVVEPAAAISYAWDRLTPERQRWCIAETRRADLARFVPDKLAPERRRLIALARGVAT